MPSTDPPPRQPRLMEQLRGALRARHYSRRTEQAYVQWARRFILFNDKRHPAQMGRADIERFLTSLAVDAHVSASTQNQALAALMFLYRDLLGRDVDWLEDVVRAKQPTRLPVVLTRDEVSLVLGRLTGRSKLMATLLYGAGLRLLECCHLRVKDIDFATNQVTVRAGKGDKDRITLLPASIKRELHDHLQAMRAQHHRDLGRGAGWVEMPDRLGLKYPNAGREWKWQWVFPATRWYRDRETLQ
ncbi:MAG TPA: integron integrase, partial [Ktedonobacterales bacterium]|nr:integron integrase [Ktedonobacterales bacterium]